MTTAEIIILIVGAILFTISFFVPDKDSESDGTGYIDKSIAEQAVKDAVKEEMKKVKTTIDEATEESITENKDKMERFMDRLTNEKMMAVNEYSDTVLNQIHKDHDEAVFLYDMIDSKYNQVKSTAAEINQIEKSVKKLSEEVPKEVPKAVTKEAPKTDSQPVQKQEKVPAKKESYETKKSESEQLTAKTEETAVAVEAVKTEETAEINGLNNFEPLFAQQLERVTDEIPEKPAKKKQTRAKKAEVAEVITEPIAGNGVELMFDNGSMNNNDRILALHNEGKSNMAIAKELGLGVGEVKLVIDLFKSN